ncbi:SCP-like protein [Ancylostoma caninum]|uniref:SCP-like protein n=1 Tax=Ancylostoma caninum TaxID=29170 RepID=A0A368GXE1_ANCCA|nr:SCP-like protein [Ancylostoma caninum]
MAAFLSICVILFALFETLLAQGNATTAAPTRPPWPKPNCGNAKLTNSMRNLILNLHNNFRGRVARGQTEVSAGWGIAPPATIMYRMKYDCNAESYAQQAVSTCRKTPLPASALGGHKQNLHVLNTVHTTPVGAIQNALATWWSELARFGMRSNMMFYQSEFRRGSRNVLNWSKMAWWNNRRVGCAVQSCGGYFVTSCMYSPGGNNVNQYVYRVGAVCSDCPAGQCDGEALCRW